MWAALGIIGGLILLVILFVIGVIIEIYLRMKKKQ